MNVDNLIFPYDHIIIIIFSIIIIFGFVKGFVQSILGLLTWIGSILLTIYSYESFNNFLISQILKIELIQNYEYLINILSLIISIPAIFLISLFILKRIRKFITSDLDKKILGTFIDKIFGIFYGMIFSYVMLTSLLILINRFELEKINNWLLNNSYITSQIEIFNKDTFNLLPMNIDELQDN